MTPAFEWLYWKPKNMRCKEELEISDDVFCASYDNIRIPVNNTLNITLSVKRKVREALY